MGVWWPLHTHIYIYTCNKPYWFLDETPNVLFVHTYMHIAYMLIRTLSCVRLKCRSTVTGTQLEWYFINYYCISEHYQITTRSSVDGNCQHLIIILYLRVPIKSQLTFHDIGWLRVYLYIPGWANFYTQRVLCFNNLGPYSGKFLKVQHFSVTCITLTPL